MPDKELKVMIVNILSGLKKEWRNSVRPSKKRYKILKRTNQS